MATQTQNKNKTVVHVEHVNMDEVTKENDSFLKYLGLYPFLSIHLSVQLLIYMKIFHYLNFFHFNRWKYYPMQNYKL